MDATTTTGPRPAAPSRRRRSVVWPTLLIGVGVLFLLQNFGLLPWNLWGHIWRLWPLVLVAVGVDLLFGGRVRGALLVLFVLALLGVGVAVMAASPWRMAGADGPIETRSFAQPTMGATQANVRVEFGAGRLEIGALGTGGDRLAEALYEGPAAFQPEQRYSVRNGVGDLRYGLRGRDRNGFHLFGRGAPHHLAVNLSPDVPTSLRVTAGAAEARLDLSQLRLSSLEVETGASSTWLRLPEAGGTTMARVQAGAASVEIEVPPGVAAQIRYDGGLSSVDVDQTRFPSTGTGIYRSPEYDTAQNRVDLRLDAGAASVSIR